MPLDELKATRAKISSELAGCPYVKDLDGIIKQLENVQIGKVAPEFSLPDTAGVSVSLSDFRGKYVLLDFWGTWCGACIAGMPEMKKFAEKHADKLLLLGIAKESNRENWKKYLAKSEWNWKQIIVGEGEEDYIARFNVQGFPTKILTVSYTHLTLPTN